MAKPMYGKYHLDPNSGVNPPWAPAHPVEWGCALHTLVIMTRVKPEKLAKLVRAGNPPMPFELVNDRVAFQFMASPGHTMSYHCMQTFDLMVTTGVKYEGFYANTGAEHDIHKLIELKNII
jgi:acetoacetate decarboxylase